MADNSFLNDHCYMSKNPQEKKKTLKRTKNRKVSPVSLGMGLLKTKTKYRNGSQNSFHISLSPIKQTESTTSVHLAQGITSINFTNENKVSRNATSSLLLPYISKSNQTFKTQSKFSTHNNGQVPSVYSENEKETKSLSPLPLKREKTLSPNPAKTHTFVQQMTLQKQRENYDNESNILSVLQATYPKYKDPLHSSFAKGEIMGFGVNSYKGLIRKYNEDRVTILLNISKPKNFKGEWPKNISMFGLFDGHGGSKCCNFLRDKAHLYIIHSPFFPHDIEASAKEAFERLEREFLEHYATNLDGQLIDKSGSCALILLIIDKTAYIINVGDSRAVLSSNKGKRVLQLSNDHKPNEKREKKRILEHQGVVYQVNNIKKIYRVIPGNLTVSRSIGDMGSKLPQFGGKEKVIISVPEVTTIKLDESADFIILGSDGVFDNIGNQEMVDSIWATVKSRETLAADFHEQAGVGADMMVKFALSRKSKDNLTGIFVGLEGYLRYFEKMKKKQKRKNKFKLNIEKIKKLLYDNHEKNQNEHEGLKENFEHENVNDLISITSDCE